MIPQAGVSGHAQRNKGGITVDSRPQFVQSKDRSAEHKGLLNIGTPRDPVETQNQNAESS
jgi:hypothetical protein